MLYLKLLAKEIKYRFGLLAVSSVAFVAMFLYNGRTVGNMEYLYMLFALAACAFILSEDEQDLLILGHIQLAKVFVFRFASAVLSVVLVPSVCILFFTKERHPVKAVVAFVVTVFVISAIGAFFRVLLKSTMASLICALITFTLLMFLGNFGIFSLFSSMSIANMKKFYLNRSVWSAVTATLLALAVLLLHLRDRFRIP